MCCGLLLLPAERAVADTLLLRAPGVNRDGLGAREVMPELFAALVVILAHNLIMPDVRIKVNTYEDASGGNRTLNPLRAAAFETAAYAEFRHTRVNWFMLAEGLEPPTPGPSDQCLCQIGLREL